MALYMFASTDAGAPTLSGTAGDLCAVLDAVLVDGYNTKTITITRSSTTATANCTSHGFVTGQRVVVSGADQPDYNITARVTVTDANNFTYTVANSPTTPATGTISAKVAPLGWSTAYTATNKRAYRQKAGTNQFYLRVNDDGSGSAAYARLVGYETMSGIDTGTGPFPTDALLAGGAYAYKSNAANGTTRAWFIYANDKRFHISVQADGSYLFHWWFGDFPSFFPGDLYNTAISAGMNGLASNYPGDNSGFIEGTTSTPSNGGTFFPRSFNGTGGSVGGSMGSKWGSSNLSSTSHNSRNYPLSNGGGILQSNLLVGEATSRIGPRGWLPGLWDSPQPLHSSIGNNDTWSGAVGSALEGRSFIIRRHYAGSIIYETSDTWDD